MTRMKCTGDFLRDSYEGRNRRVGIREFGMGAVCNAVSLHKTGLVPYCATFAVFSDYMRVTAVGGDGTALLTRDGVIVACRRFGVPVDDLSYALAAAGGCRPPCLVRGCGAPLERAARPYSEVTAPP